MNLLNMFKGKHKEEVKIENIELYCQNPQCKKLINLGEEVAEVNGSLVHLTEDCIEMYMCHEAIKTRDVVICTSINYLPYVQAEKLARKGEIKFNKLKNKTGESQ